MLQRFTHRTATHNQQAGAVTHHQQAGSGNGWSTKAMKGCLSHSRLRGPTLLSLTVAQLLDAHHGLAASKTPDQLMLPRCRFAA